MKMTLEDAKRCINRFSSCDNCKFVKQTEFECRSAAYDIAEACINYCLIGKKLTNELEGKER